MFADGYTGGKADVSAKVKVEFEGYHTPVVKSFSIKAKETQPKLQQSRNTTKLTASNINGESITVLDQSTGKNLNLKECNLIITSKSDGYVTYDFDKDDLIHALKNDKNIEKRIKEIVTDVVTDLFRVLWQRRSSYESELKR